MKRIISCVEYDTDTATMLHNGPTLSLLDNLTVLYLGSNNHPFIVGYSTLINGKENGELRPFDRDRDMAWLENTRAPRSVYEALGIEIEDA